MGRGQAQGHAAPSLRLGPGAGSELPPACVYKTAYVFLCELREEGQEAHLFLIPQKALLSGPGGAGVPVEDCEGEGGEERASERSHAHSTCRVRCGLFLQPPPPSLPSTPASFRLTFSECE